MSAYVQEVNGALLRALKAGGPITCFGQNITSGSRLSGLTAGLQAAEHVETLNTPNTENALVGFGFGLMMAGRNSVFFVKQLDFLLLALDQMVNTYNVARLSEPTGSFTIVPIVVDSGFEGPQSRLNALADFCSMGDFSGYCIGDSSAAGPLFEAHIHRPGFRIIAVSQRLFRDEREAGRSARPLDPDGAVFQFGQGDAATIVAFNFAWVQAQGLSDALAARDLKADLYAVSDARMTEGKVSAILDSLKRTGRLVIVDDSRSCNRPGDRLLALVMEAGLDTRFQACYRPVLERDIRPNADRFEVDLDRVLRSLHL